jgi:hypothetical protein
MVREPVRCPDAAAQPAQPGARWTLWVKSPDTDGCTKLKGVDPGEDVHDVIERWLRVEQLDVLPSRVLLKLVRFVGKQPTAEEMAAAEELGAWQKLLDTDVKDGSLLLVNAECTRAGACNGRGACRCLSITLI